MTAPAMRLSLRAGEKIYVNGAVLKVDRKTTIELMNDAAFLLEAHVLQPDQATTPLRQLYFVAQTMLISPEDAEEAALMFRDSLLCLIGTFEDRQVLEGLRSVGESMAEGRVFEAMKTIRGLFPREDDILGIARSTEAA